MRICTSRPYQAPLGDGQIAFDACACWEGASHTGSGRLDLLKALGGLLSCYTENFRDSVCQLSSKPRLYLPSGVCVSSSKARVVLRPACVPDGRCHRGVTGAWVFSVKHPSSSAQSWSRLGKPGVGYCRAAGVRDPSYLVSLSGPQCRRTLFSPRSPLISDRTPHAPSRSAAPGSVPESHPLTG